MGDFQNKENTKKTKIFKYAHVLGKCSFTQPTIKVNNS